VANVYQLPRLLSMEQKEDSPEEFGKDGAGTKATGFEAFCIMHLE
jgi:hypothetical protein